MRVPAERVPFSRGGRPGAVIPPTSKPVTQTISFPTPVHVASVTSQQGYWLLKESSPDYADYKNGILRQYQDALASRCDLPRNGTVYFVAQVLQENGALDPALTGGTDRGYSFGLGQWNHSPVKATTWLEEHPEQKNPQWQIAQLATDSCDAYQRFHGNIEKAVIARNCPQCALYGGDWTYFADVSRHLKDLAFLP